MADSSSGGSQQTANNPLKTSPADSTAGHDPSVKRKGVIKPTIVAIGKFAQWIVLLPTLPFRKNLASDEVIVYSAHPSFYLWLLIVVGFVGSWIVGMWPGTEHFLGWVYIWSIMYFAATLLYDFSTKKLLLWVGIFLLLWLASKYLEDVKQVVVLGRLFQYLASLEPRFDRGTATVLSWLFLFPWIGSLCYMALNGRKKFTPNEIGEFHFGEGSELTDRTGLRFRTQYRDVLESLLTFGGGDLLAVDNHHNVIKRWDNIVGLFFLWKQLDRVLHQRSVVESADAEK